MAEITQNGVFPPGSLARTHLFYPGTASGRMIRKDIQPYADAMALAFALEFGKPLCATDGARDFATQERLRAEKGVWAAIPGTSNHGWAKAFDLASNIPNAGSPEHDWIVANEARFGFEWPFWARDDNPRNGQFEPWHHEFVGGGKSSPRVLAARTGLGEVGMGHTDEVKVREIQERLNFHLPDEHHIKVDGDFGFMTAVAVVRFQMLRRAYVSGRVSLLLLARLRKDVDSTRYERALARLRARRARAKARLERAS